MAIRVRYHWATARSLQDVDAALTLAGGNRAAAAKLLDMSLEKIKNLINYHPSLKQKWGYVQCGRPKTAPFRIDPFTFHVEPSLGVLKALIHELPSDERAELAGWMKAQIVEPKVAPHSFREVAAGQ